MADTFSEYLEGLSTPISNGEAVDISSADHTASNTCKALWVGTAGNVKCDVAGTTGITFNNVQDGTLLPFRITVVVKTGTTASNMVAVW